MAGLDGERAQFVGSVASLYSGVLPVFLAVGKLLA